MGSCNITQVINKIDGTLATDNRLQIADCENKMHPILNHMNLIIKAEINNLSLLVAKQEHK